MKRVKRNQHKKSSPKHSLNLPDLDYAKSAVLNSLPSKESQRGYRHAIDEFVAWYLLRAEIIVQQSRRHPLSNTLGVASACTGHD
jgi:hypothetical protein